MKKLLTILTSFAAMATVGSSVVSCMAPALARGPEGQKVLFITDGGNIEDKSFNEGAYNAIKKYTREIDFQNQELLGLTTEFNEIKVPEPFKSIQEWKDAVDAMDVTATAQWNEMLDQRLNNTAIGSYDSSTNYVESKDASSAGLKASYKMGEFLKPDAIVLAGFVHLSEIESFAKSIPDTSIILADGTVDYSNGKNKNIISIKFNSELAGFAAAIDAAIWSIQNLDKVDINDDEVIRVGTFAGISSKYSVDNYMWGLIAGFNLMNKYLDDSKEPITNYRFESANAGKGKSADFEDINVLAANDQKWFSNSFGLGDATKSGLVDSLLNTGKADIVFPVAGPQILDVLSSQISQPYLIGVDTNQVYSYNSYKDRFLSSAIKNLEFAISDELKEAKSLKTIEGYDGEVNKGTIGNVSVQDADGNITEGLDYADGNIVASKGTWSINATGGDNLIQQSAIDYDGKEAWLKDLVINEFAQAGETPDKYMQGSVIKDFAEEVLANNEEWEAFKTKIDNLIKGDA
ncbi:hypothetical protein [Mesoplasma photuris]|uniref:hypothetical protein n=1 Tax=Mesoplasma photuris TaxID=217731 RepID=UPI0004E0FD70|nr:hypothetical protein [Mesoplasma photuris]